MSCRRLCESMGIINSDRSDAEHPGGVHWQRREGWRYDDAGAGKRRAMCLSLTLAINSNHARHPIGLSLYSQVRLRFVGQYVAH